MNRENEKAAPVMHFPLIRTLLASIIGATDRQDSADRHQKGISLYIFVYEKKIFSNFRFHIGTDSFRKNVKMIVIARKTTTTMTGLSYDFSGKGSDQERHMRHIK
jgi:hypothetical protein